MHSMKDMPSQPAVGLIFARAWKREDARDVLILRKEKSLWELPGGAVIGPGGVVPAAAGLKRLGMEQLITQYLEIDEMVPAPAQGILALEIQSSNERLLSMLNALADEETEREAFAEREFLKEMGGGCHAPAGAFCEKDKGGELRLRAIYGDESGSWLKRVSVTGKEPKALARQAAEQISKERKGNL